MVIIVKGSFENMAYASPIRNPASNEKIDNLTLSVCPSAGKATFTERKKRELVIIKIAESIMGKDVWESI